MSNSEIIFAVCQAINRATNPTEAALPVLRWINNIYGPALVSLAQGQTEVLVSPEVVIEQEVTDWIVQHTADYMRDTIHRLETHEVAGPALLIPLRYDQHYFGLLWVYGYLPMDESLLLLAQVLVARLHHFKQWNLSNTASFKDLKLAIQTEMISLVNSTVRLSELASRVYGTLRPLLEPDSFAFGIFDRERDTIDLVIHEGDSHYQRSYLYAPDQNIVSHIIANKQPVTWNDTLELNAAAPPGDPNIYPLSFIGVPLMTRGEVSGILYIEAMRPMAFDKNSLDLLSIFAVGLALAAANSQLYRSAGRRNQEITAITEVSRTLATRPSSSEIWGLLDEQLSMLFDSSSFYVALYNEDDGLLSFPLLVEEGIRISTPEPRPLSGISRAVIVHGTALLFHNLALEQERAEALGIHMDEHWEDNSILESLSCLAVPLRKYNNEVIGVISVQNYLPDIYNAGDLSVLMSIAAQVALALDSRDLLMVDQERRKVTNTLIDIGRDLSSTLDYAEVMDRVLDQMLRVVSYDSACIMLIPKDVQDSSRMVISAAYGLPPYVRGQDVDMRDSRFNRQILESKQPLVVDDVQKYSDWQNWGDRDHGNLTRSWIGVPLLIEDRVIGMITLDKSIPGYYTQKDASTALAVANYAAIAVENARLHAQSEMNLRALEMHNHLLTSMHKLSIFISSTLDRDEILRSTAKHLQQLFKVDHCGIVLIDSESGIKGDGVLVAEYPLQGNIGLRVPIESDYSSVTGFPGKVTVMDQIDDSRIQKVTQNILRQMKVKSALFASLVARERYIGSIGLDSTSRYRVFTEEEKEIFATVSTQLALAINNADLYVQAVAANRLKDEFLANISHELRTPLNAIMGYTEMVLQRIYGEVNDLQADRLNRVLSSSKQLHDLISDVLDLSKIEAGQMDIAMESLKMQEVLMSALDSLSLQAESKKLKIEVDLAPDLPFITGDSQRIRQILINLIDNAIKFTHEGKIYIRVGVLDFEGFTINDANIPALCPVNTGQWLMVSVRDTGIGIAPETQKIIFDPFRQGDGSSIREYAGTGLGLAISNRLVTLHKGHLWVKSAPDKGSTFTMLLPLNTTEVSESDTLELPPLVDTDKRLVVVVDNDPAALQLTKDYLGNQDCQVLGLRNPAHVQRIALHYKPDVIILDALMPYTSGWDLLETLKSTPETAHIPVILWSTDEAPDDYDANIAAYLTKPIQQQTLIKLVNRIMEQDKF
jgi:signal transduction histidine kinase